MLWRQRSEKLLLLLRAASITAQLLIASQ